MFDLTNNPEFIFVLTTLILAIVLLYFGNNSLEEYNLHPKRISDGNITIEFYVLKFKKLIKYISFLINIVTRLNFYSFFSSSSVLYSNN